MRISDQKGLGARVSEFRVMSRKPVMHLMCIETILLVSIVKGNYAERV